MPARLALLVGPLLFLAAQLLIPGVTADPVARHDLIAAAPERWALSHQLFIVAFAFALMWLYRLRRALEPAAPRLAAAGAFFAGFALLADFGIASLQLLALEAVRTLPGPEALAVMKLATSPAVAAAVFLPYLGFAVGFVLLALALAAGARAGRRATADTGIKWMLAPLLLSAAGLALTAGGLAGHQPTLVAGAGLWLAFTIAWPRDPVQGELPERLAPSRA